MPATNVDATQLGEHAHHDGPEPATGCRVEDRGRTGVNVVSCSACRSYRRISGTKHAPGVISRPSRSRTSRGNRPAAVRGITITMALTADEWGERSFQARDPNGVVVQLVDWNGAADPPQ